MPLQLSILSYWITCSGIRMNITNRCSCPLRGRPERRMQPGNPRECGVDAAGQLNSMFRTPDMPPWEFVRYFRQEGCRQPYSAF